MAITILIVNRFEHFLYFITQFILYVTLYSLLLQMLFYVLICERKWQSSFKSCWNSKLSQFYTAECYEPIQIYRRKSNCLWSYHHCDFQGVLHIDFLEIGTMINLKCYLGTFGKLRARLRCVREDLDPIFYQDNSCPHISCETQELQLLQFKDVLHHMSYRLEPALCDSHLFAKNDTTLQLCRRGESCYPALMSTTTTSFLLRQVCPTH